MKAEDGEQILLSLIRRHLLTKQQLSHILHVAATEPPNRAHQLLLRWAQREFATDGYVTQTAPARAARSLAKLRLANKSGAFLFQKVHDRLFAELHTKRPPP